MLDGSGLSGVLRDRRRRSSGRRLREWRLCGRLSRCPPRLSHGSCGCRGCNWRGCRWLHGLFCKRGPREQQPESGQQRNTLGGPRAQHDRCLTWCVSFHNGAGRGRTRPYTRLATASAAVMSGTHPGNRRVLDSRLDRRRNDWRRIRQRSHQPAWGGFPDSAKYARIRSLVHLSTTAAQAHDDVVMHWTHCQLVRPRVVRTRTIVEVACGVDKPALNFIAIEHRCRRRKLRSSMAKPAAIAALIRQTELTLLGPGRSRRQGNCIPHEPSTRTSCVEEKRC